MQRFFFITTYDTISGGIVAAFLNKHEKIHCHQKDADPFLLKEARQQKLTVDALIATQNQSDHIFNGNAQYYSAFELQNNILAERTVLPIYKVNVVMDPHLRVHLLLKSWQNHSSADAAIEIEQKFLSLIKKKHKLFYLYRVEDVYLTILDLAKKNAITIDTPEKRLFTIALTICIAFDSADLPLPGKVIRFEDLLKDQTAIIDLIKTISNDKLEVDQHFLNQVREDMRAAATEIAGATPWEAWQNQLFEQCLHLKTLYTPHDNRTLATLYQSLGYAIGQPPQRVTYSKLISIQLNSNRPAQLVAYFDNIEATADHPYDIEVLVNIDEDNIVMKETLIREASIRPFTINYVTTPRPQSFCDLWQPINKLLKITDPNAYFLLNISDEMLFATKGWDTILKKYVGYFPDHLFRLRASRNKLRNYFDRWECSFAQDSIPITTKRWVEIGGDWNPCFGPDSFQQLIAFYLAKEGMFSGSNFLRDIPILDIEFHGDIPSLGIEPKKMWKHIRDHANAMLTCQSHSMQQEARRRAILIKAHMQAFAQQLTQYDVVDNKTKKQIHLIDQETQQTVLTMDYRLSWLAITFTNQWRKLRFSSYFGGGKESNKNIILSFAGYLKAKYYSFHLLYIFLKKYAAISKKILTHHPMWSVNKVREKMQGLSAKEK